MSTHPIEPAGPGKARRGWKDSGLESRAPRGTSYRICPRSGLQFEAQAEKLMIANAVAAVVIGRAHV